MKKQRKSRLFKVEILTSSLAVLLGLGLSLVHGCANPDYSLIQLNGIKPDLGPVGNAYRATVYPWVRKNCATCHDGSSAILAHAHPDSSIAWAAVQGKEDFIRLADPDLSLIYKRMGPDDQHNCPPEGCEQAQLDVEQIILAMREMVTAVDPTLVADSILPRIETEAIRISPDVESRPDPEDPEDIIPGTIQELRFDLSEILGVPGAELIADLGYEDPVYGVSNVRILAPVPVYVKGIHFHINGIFIPTESTLAAVEEVVEANSEDYALNFGITANKSEINGPGSDKISAAFVRLEVAN